MDTWTQLSNQSFKVTGVRPFSGCGIHHNKSKKTSILRSVDEFESYADDLSNPNEVLYTLEDMATKI